MKKMISGFYVTDKFGTFYKLSEKGNVVTATGINDARVFTQEEIEKHIGKRKKLRMYNLIDTYDFVEAPITEDNTQREDKKPINDMFNVNWETTLSHLNYMSSNIEGYRSSLNMRLSDIDQEICDVMHYLEFEDLDESALIDVSKMLKKMRQNRREIKDEMDRANAMCSTFLTDDFQLKLQQSISMIEKMKMRKYTPRKLEGLFKTDIISSMS